jgi:hypothetical protein
MALRKISTPPNRPPFWLEHALRGGRLTRRYQALTSNTRRENIFVLSPYVLVLAVSPCMEPNSPLECVLQPKGRPIWRGRNFAQGHGLVLAVSPGMEPNAPLE